jgi:hypothetical protein
MSKSGLVTRGIYTAQFEVTGKMLKLTSVFGVKQAQLGSLPAEVLAGMLLGEQITEAKLMGE